MNCPSCAKNVKDGTSICPFCEAVLDESILGAINEDTVDDTPPPEAVKPKKVKKPARKPAPIAADEPPPAKPKDGPAKPTSGDDKSGKYQGKYAQYWTEEEPTDMEMASNKARAEAKEQDEAGKVVEPMEQLKSVWAAFLGLHFEDKMTTAASAAMALMTFMPWKTTTEGDSMGLFGNGLFVLLFAVVAVLAIWLRKTNKIPKVARGSFPLLSIGAGGFAALVGVISAVTSFEKGVKAGQAVTTGWPAFGVFCAILCAAGVVVGGLLTLKREK
jgi:hypothetical protein